MSKFLYNTKKILVTGGAGSIGSVLIKKALSKGAQKVFACDTDEIRLYELVKTINDERLESYVMDIKDPASIERTLHLVGKIDVLFHAAALKHVPVCENNPIESVLTNIIGTQNVVDATFKWNIPISVMISTDKAVNPQNVMGASKFIAEKIFLKAAENSNNQNFFVVRFGNVANSRGSVIPVLLKSLAQKNEIIITDLGVTRFIMRIEEAVNLIFKAIDISVGGEIFVLKMPAFSLADLLDVLIKDTPVNPRQNPTDVKIKTIGLMKGEKKHEELFEIEETSRVKDLGSFYGVINIERFPKHKKYSTFMFAKEIPFSSKDAIKISKSDLKKIVSENITN